MEIPWSSYDIDLALAETSLYQFVQQAWKVVDPDPFVPGWHIEAVCQHLEAISRGAIRNLIVNIPPRFTKSSITNVMWPAWEWGPFNKTDSRWLCMSYSADLTLRDSLKCRTLIQSEWYQKRWGHRFQLTGDQNAKERYNNTKKGHRVASSIGGLGTGEGGSRLVIDDPHNIKEIESDAARNSVINWWDGVMPTRKNDPKKSSTVIIMQRSHHKDLVGHIYDTDRVSYEWLVLPNEFEEKRRCSTSIGFVDPRVEEGELLWPARFGQEETQALKRRMGAYAYAGQFQQRPAPLEGGIFKRHWWPYYQVVPEVDVTWQSWDCSFKDLKSSDFVSGQVWGAKGANVFLLDRVHGRWAFTETCKRVEALTARWPQTRWKFVEEKANGAAVIDTLKNKIPGIIPVNPKESKESRAFAVTPDVEAGNVILPCPALAPWIDEVIEEWCTFPNAPHDDDTDAMTQAISEYRKRVKHLEFPSVVSVTRHSPWVSA